MYINKNKKTFNRGTVKLVLKIKQTKEINIKVKKQRFVDLNFLLIILGFIN